MSKINLHRRRAHAPAHLATSRDLPAHCGDWVDRSPADQLTLRRALAAAICAPEGAATLLNETFRCAVASLGDSAAATGTVGIAAAAAKPAARCTEPNETFRFRSALCASFAASDCGDEIVCPA